MIMNTKFLFLLLLPTYLMGQSNKPLVLATASIFADMAQEIGGDQIDVQSIVPIGGDPHIYEPVPSDAQRVFNADLILINGLTFEGWINKLVQNSGTQAEIVLITKGIEPIRSQTYENATDPHAWMDAKKGLQYIQNIYEALSKLIPKSDSLFKINYERYRSELLQLDEEIKSQISEISKENRVLITSHDAFRYYGQRYGLQLESVLGTSTDADVQTKDIIRITELLSNTSVPSVFIESTINPKLMQQIAKDNGVKIGGKLYADSLGDKDSPASTYLNMLRYNTQTIVKGLKGQRPSASNDSVSYKSNSKYIIVAAIGLLLVLGFIFVKRK